MAVLSNISTFSVYFSDTSRSWVPLSLHPGITVRGRTSCVIYWRDAVVIHTCVIDWNRTGSTMKSIRFGIGSKKEDVKIMQIVLKRCVCCAVPFCGHVSVLQVRNIVRKCQKGNSQHELFEWSLRFTILKQSLRIIHLKAKCYIFTYKKLNVGSTFLIRSVINTQLPEMCLPFKANLFTKT